MILTYHVLNVFHYLVETSSFDLSRTEHVQNEA